MRKGRAVIYLSYFFALLILSGCVKNNTFITAEKEGWFNISEDSVYYCKANNIDKTNSADPVCFEAAIKIYKDN
jgi:hypothetical protein